MKVITAKMLKDARACPQQVRLFRRTFGEKAKVTAKNCRKAAATGLSLEWAVAVLLSDSAREAYNAAVIPKSEAHLTDVTIAWQKCNRSEISRAEYKAICLHSLDALRAIKAKAFYEACRDAKGDEA